MRTACLISVAALSVGSLGAHEVSWFENFFSLGTSMQLNFGLDECDFPDHGTIGILPSEGEPCVVAVSLDPTTSPWITTSFRNGIDTANFVWIDVDVNPTGRNTVNTFVSGEWHATGFPTNAGCTATNPNPFFVPITIQAPTPWSVLLTMPGIARIDTGGILTGLRAADSLSGPWYNVGVGSNFIIGADLTTQFYKRTHSIGGALAGFILDGSGSPQSGINIGFQYGGLKSPTLSDGSFSMYGLPRGTNIIAVTKPISFVDSQTGSNRTEEVGVNVEVPAVSPTNTYYHSLVLQIAILLIPVPACNCTPWCAIGFGTLDGAHTPVFYSGGALPPKSGPANCAAQVTVTPPSGVAYAITAGSSKHQNSGPNPASGTWTVTTTVCGQSKQASISVP